MQTQGPEQRQVNTEAAAGDREVQNNVCPPETPVCELS